MKTILFLSDQNRYLEHNLYQQIARNLGEGFRSIYLESEIRGDIYYKSSKEKDQEEKRAAFDEYRHIPPLELDQRDLHNPVLKLLRVWKNLYRKLSWRKEFLETIDALKPDLCILITTLSPNGKMACMYRPGLKKVYVQPSTSRAEILPNRGLHTKLRDWIYEWVLKLPLIPQKELGFNNIDNVDYLLWSELWIRHVERNKQSNYISVGAPHFDTLFRQRQELHLNRRFRECLVILNKEHFIGIEAWYEYAYFYQEIVAANPDINFIFKVHPLGDLEAAKNLFPDCEVTRKDFTLTEADCILTHWSTLALDAMILKIPTLLINPGGNFDFRSKYFDDYDFIFETPSAVNGQLERMKRGDLTPFHEAAEAYLKLSLTYTDGNSTERIISHLKHLVAH